MGSLQAVEIIEIESFLCINNLLNFEFRRRYKFKSKYRMLKVNWKQGSYLNLSGSYNYKYQGGVHKLDPPSL